jgi:hypothetical protein
MYIFGKGFNRAKAGFEPTASAHEAEILTIKLFRYELYY